MKAIVGLGNPGPRYDATRHNVGWWALDRFAYDWDFDGFVREGPALVATGVRDGVPIQLIKPTTYMNRSGAALMLLRGHEDFDVRSDLLVVVDDATLDVGRVRFRPSGSAGGHNGLKSIEGALGSREYPRLRIGVGVPPPGEDLADWVLSPMDADDEETVVALLPELTRAADAWIAEGTEAAMNKFNR